jgi:hypothetical protein
MGTPIVIIKASKHITFITQHCHDNDNDDSPPICSQFKDKHTMGMPMSPITKKTAALLVHPTVPKPVQEGWWRSVGL